MGMSIDKKVGKCYDERIDRSKQRPFGGMAAGAKHAQIHRLPPLVARRGCRKRDSCCA